jgi:protein-arginine kinase activator protein McsA
VVEKIQAPAWLEKIKFDLTDEQIKFYASQEDTECKRTFDCPKTKMTYYDTEGRIYCAEQYKVIDDNLNPYSKSTKVCHKYLGTNKKEEQEYLF